MVIKLGHIIWDKDENRWNNCVMFVSKVANCDHKLKGVFCHLIFLSKNFYKIFKNTTQPAFLCVLWMFWLGLELSQIISANIFFFISLISNRTNQTTMENGEFMALFTVLSWMKMNLSHTIIDFHHTGTLNIYWTLIWKSQQPMLWMCQSGNHFQISCWDISWCSHLACLLLEQKVRWGIISSQAELEKRTLAKTWPLILRTCPLQIHMKHSLVFFFFR